MYRLQMRAAQVEQLVQAFLEEVAVLACWVVGEGGEEGETLFFVEAAGLEFEGV
jgi:hypothetical protein